MNITKIKELANYIEAHPEMPFGMQDYSTCMMAYLSQMDGEYFGAYNSSDAAESLDIPYEDAKRLFLYPFGGDLDGNPYTMLSSMTREQAVQSLRDYAAA